VHDSQGQESKTTGISLLLEEDPCPLVKIFANKLSVASLQSDFLQKLAKVQGCFGLKSASDPQCLSMLIKGTTISLYTGIRKDAKIVIHTPLDENGPQKTRVENLWRHPLFAINVGKLLDFPKANWIDSGKRFWEKNKDYPGMPQGIDLICTDEDRQYTLGEHAEVRLSGKAKDLAEVLSGETVFIQSALTSKLRGQMSFEHAVVLSDVTLQMLLGDR